MVKLLSCLKWNAPTAETLLHVETFRVTDYYHMSAGREADVQMWPQMKTVNLSGKYM